MTDQFGNYGPELTKSTATAAKYAVQQISVILTHSIKVQESLYLRDFFCQTLNPSTSDRYNDFRQQLEVKGS